MTNYNVTKLLSTQRNLVGSVSVTISSGRLFPRIIELGEKEPKKTVTCSFLYLFFLNYHDGRVQKKDKRAKTTLARVSNNFYEGKAEK